MDVYTVLALATLACLIMALLVYSFSPAYWRWVAHILFGLAMAWGIVVLMLTNTGVDR